MSLVSAEESLIVPYPRETVFDALLQVLPRAKVKIDEASKLLWRITGHTGISLWTWKQTIIIQVVERDQNQSEVKISSHAHWQITDWGKGRGDIEKIVRLLDTHLSSLPKGS